LNNSNSFKLWSWPISFGIISIWLADKDNSSKLWSWPISFGISLI